MTRRKDGLAKVTGTETYASDMELPYMLHARVLRSPYPHARVVSIDTSEAERMGAICITPDDVPDIRYNERQVSVPVKTYRDRTVLPRVVRQVGEGVAAVAARTEALAERAMRAIKVEWEELPAVFDAHKAMADDAPRIYENVLLGDVELAVEHNVACFRQVGVGDVVRRLRRGRPHRRARVPDGTRLPRPDGAQGGGLPAARRRRHRSSGPRCSPSTTRASCSGGSSSLPLSKVRVHRSNIGGAFGSSIQMNTPVAICVALALKARKPVKIVLTREEDMYDHCKYPAEIRLKYGVRRDGTIVAGELKTLVDIGAHNIQAYPLLGCMSGWFVSLYRMPHMNFEGTAVYTNKTPACAMQGYGNPDVSFAVESHMDIIAEKLGMDPIELRLKNYVGLGEEFWGQGPTVRSIIRSCGVEEMLVKGAEMIGWERARPARGQDRPLPPRHRRGAHVPHLRAPAPPCRAR